MRCVTAAFQAQQAACWACRPCNPPQGAPLPPHHSISDTDLDSSTRTRRAGIRNVGGLAWSPDQPGRLYYTVLERDQMGNDMPDDLVQSATLQTGTDYRFPYCHWWGWVGGWAGACGVAAWQSVRSRAMPDAAGRRGRGR